MGRVASFRAEVPEKIDVEIPEAAILEWVQDNFSPGEVFDADELEDWAAEHGFTKD